MRRLVFAGLLLGLLGCEVSTGSELVSRAPAVFYTDAESVRLFVRADQTEGGGPDHLETNGRLLSTDERRAFEEAISIASYRQTESESDAAACFVPHHFFRYYDAQGEQVGEIAVCFCCYGVFATRGLDESVAAGADYADLEFDEPALRRLVQRMGLPVDINCG